MKRKMLNTLFLLIAGVFSLAWVSPGARFATEAQGAENPGKILVAYFSWSGNTRELAKQIHERVGGDLFEIKVAEAYPAEYRPCTEQAKREQNENARPALSTKVEDMASYDVVFVGYPNWWGTLPMALFTFFEQYDFSGKRIVPFCTHASGGFGRSLQDIAKLSPNATVLEGFEVRGSSSSSARSDVSAWLDRIGMAN